MTNGNHREKNFARIIYAIASLSMSLRFFLDIVLKQKEPAGVAVTFIFIMLGFIFIDRSNLLPFKLNKKDTNIFVEYTDNLGFAMVIYLFYIAVFKGI